MNSTHFTNVSGTRFTASLITFYIFPFPFPNLISSANLSSPPILKAFASHRHSLLQNTYTKCYCSLKKYNLLVHKCHHYCHSKNTGTLPAFSRSRTLNCGQSVLWNKLILHWLGDVDSSWWPVAAVFLWSCKPLAGYNGCTSTIHRVHHCKQKHAGKYKTCRLMQLWQYQLASLLAETETPFAGNKEFSQSQTSLVDVGIMGNVVLLHDYVKMNVTVKPIFG